MIGKMRRIHCIHFVGIGGSGMSGIAEVMLSYKIKSGYHGNPPLPEAFGCCQLVKRLAAFIDQKRPHDMRSRCIHEVPIIDVRRIVQTSVINCRFGALLPFFKHIDKQKKSQHSFFMVC